MGDLEMGTTTTTATTTTTITTTTTTSFCDEDPKKNILLTVTDIESGEPISDVRVIITTADLNSNQQFSSQHSNVDGTVKDFTMDSGAFTVSAAHEGYLSKHEVIIVDCASIECEDCENQFSIELEKISNVNITDPVDPIDNSTIIEQVCPESSGSVS